MAAGTRKTTTDENAPDLADRVHWVATGENPYKEAYAESRPNATKTVDPFSEPEKDVLTQNGFVGTDPIYQNYAGVAGRPLTEDDKVNDKDFDKGSPEDEPEVTGENNSSTPTNDTSNQSTTPTPVPTPPVV